MQAGICTVILLLKMRDIRFMISMVHYYIYLSKLSKFCYTK